MEGWSYVESFYFAFITLSTVGFGDYVIGEWPWDEEAVTQLPRPPRQAWECAVGGRCLMWVAWWAWGTAFNLSRLCPFPGWWVVISQVLPASVELSSKATGLIGALEGHTALGPPSVLHASHSHPPNPGEDPDETIGELRAPSLPWASGGNDSQCKPARKAGNGVH